MLALTSKHLTLNDINSDVQDRLGFEKSSVTYLVDRGVCIGKGTFMSCYKAKVLIDGETREMVAKQDSGVTFCIESYLALAQRYVECERSIEIFKTAIKDMRAPLPEDLRDLCNQIRVSFPTSV